MLILYILILLLHNMCAGCLKSIVVSRWPHGLENSLRSTSGILSARTSRNFTGTSRPWTGVRFQWMLPEWCGTRMLGITYLEYVTTYSKIRRRPYRKRWANCKGNNGIRYGLQSSYFVIINATSCWLWLVRHALFVLQILLDAQDGTMCFCRDSNTRS